MKIQDSKIHGKGAFSDKKYKKGELIGLAHTNDQPSTDLGRYHNHSETPNSESKKIGNQRYLYTSHPLKKGEEITVDYRKQPELEQPDKFNNMKDQNNPYEKILQYMQMGGMWQNYMQENPVKPFSQGNPQNPQRQSVTGSWTPNKKSDGTEYTTFEKWVMEQERTAPFNQMKEKGALGYLEEARQKDNAWWGNTYDRMSGYAGQLNPNQQVQSAPNYQQEVGTQYSVDANGNPVSVPSMDMMNNPIFNQNQTIMPPVQDSTIMLSDQELGIGQRGQVQTTNSINSTGIAPIELEGEKAIRQNTDEKYKLPEHDAKGAEKRQMYNPYASYDTSAAAYILGNAIGGGESKGRGALAAGKLALSLGRDLTSGLGAGKRERFLEQEYNQKQRDGLTGLKEGGTFNYDQGSLTPPKRYMQEGGKLDLAKSLTGEFVEGQPPNKEEQGVVEMERGEHIMQPDGTTSEVVGKKHGQGGEKLSAEQIEEGSIVISDHLPIGGDNAKHFRKKYDIKVKAKDTYATVIDKVKDKIGITKVTKEQEEVFKQLEKEEKNTKDAVTKNLNREFLSQKVNELEQKKQELEPIRKEAMAEVYQKQEESKPKEEQQPMSVDPQMMEQLAQQNNIPQEQAQQIVEEFMRGGQYKKIMQAGGQLTREQIDGINDITGISFTEEGANQLFEMQPDQKVEVQDDPKLDYGWYKDEGYIDVSRNGDNYVINPTQKNPYNYTDYIKMVDRIKGLNPSTNIAANYIPMENRGNYQIGGTVTYSDPKAVEALEKLKKKYPKQFAKAFDVQEVDGKQIYTQKEGYNVASTDVYFETDLGKIDSDPREKVSTVKEWDGLDPKALKNDSELLKRNTGITEDSPVDGIANTDDKEKKEAGSPLQNLPLLPDQTVLPPSSMQPPLKVENRLGRIDSVNISPEQQLAENQRQATAYQSMIGNLPPNQQAAIMAQIATQTQNANNQAISTTNMQNAQADNQRDVYNTQAGDKENLLAGQNALNYEDRTFKTQAVYEENINQYYDYLRNVNTQNFNDVRNQYTLNNMFENYNLDGNGNIVLSPEEFQLQINKAAGITASKDTKKKKINEKSTLS